MTIILKIQTTDAFRRLMNFFDIEDNLIEEIIDQIIDWIDRDLIQELTVLKIIIIRTITQSKRIQWHAIIHFHR